MDTTFPLLFAVTAGFAHAFEADHLLAVSSMASRRSNLVLAMKDGAYWGLGHTSTILLVGLLMIIARVAISESTFHYFEASVGLMLIGLGLYRLQRLRTGQAHRHAPGAPAHTHQLAYGVGLVHGLAGSGGLVLLVMSQIQSSVTSMAYLLTFGLGSVVGMLLAASLFSLPFSKKITANFSLQTTLSLVSSLFCVGFGSWMVYENLIA
jgi:hypothetical protein